MIYYDIWILGYLDESIVIEESSEQQTCVAPNVENFKSLTCEDISRLTKNLQLEYLRSNFDQLHYLDINNQQ